MKIKKLFVLFFIISVVGCEYNELNNEIEREPETELDINEDNYVKGQLRIRVSEELAEKFDSVEMTQESILKAMTADDIAASLGLSSVKRTFPYAGRFEARTREAGLHLWYDVEFNKSNSLKSARIDLSEIEGIDIVEYRPREIRMYSDNVIPAANIVEKVSGTSKADLPFNDPRLGDQWHYYNDGSKTNYIAGADINVYEVWKNYTTGSKDIIVAVVDGGIDFSHEDLAANIWINEAEKNGTRNVDDDNNGYRDDVYGYNFIYNSGTIVPSNHGTHVAGTIGAVNNNGKGVSGIAGGNGSGNGVRLMSCQIFIDEEEGNGSGASAIKYAADNGAVICQNSWGYPSLTEAPASDKAAIDYFIQYAGLDEDGRQVGPMNGGIVVFSGGNDDKETSAPGSYVNVIGVVSIAPNYVKAYYSNYGAWADLSAPGGDQKSHGTSGSVLSTIVNGYGYMQGTSMACPHVSGVAALVVSKFGGAGFTPVMLRQKLESSATNIDDYNRGYRGKMGKGLVNAMGAIAGSSPYPPDAVTSLTGTVESNIVTLKWKVPEDIDDQKAAGFNIYYRKSPVNGININNLPDDVMITSALTGSLNARDEISCEIDDLDFETTYYFIVNAFDFSRNYSALSPQFSIATLENNPPVIEAINGTSITLSAHETVSLNFNIFDPDGHQITWNFNPGSTAAEATELNKRVQVRIVGTKADAGIYAATLIVKDKYDAETSQIINYTLLPNIPPRVVEPIENMHIGGVNREITIPLSNHFIDDNGETLSYSITNSVDGIAYINANQGILYIVSARYGLADVTVTATDALGEKCAITFKVLVRDETQEVDLYPNPVVNNLYIRMEEEKNCNVAIFNNAGVKVIEKTLIVSPFDPAVLDMSNLSGGAYSVDIRYDNKQISRTVIKL